MGRRVTPEAADMAADLLAHRGSLASPEVRRLRAGAVVRAGVEGEASRGQSARFRAVRRGREVLVAFTDHPACARPLRPVWSDAM